MNGNGTVNSQLLDSAGTSLVLSLGSSAPASMALTYATAADTMGLMMHNAITTQHGMQTVARAAVATVCAQIVASATGAGSAPGG